MAFHTCLLYTLTVTALLHLTDAYNSWPVCSPFYGQPDPWDCDQLLWSTRSVRQGTEAGFAYTDTHGHFFATATTPRPALDRNGNPISDTQWRGRHEIPIFRTNGDCKLALIPRTTPNGAPGIDWGTYLSIARQAERVHEACTYPPNRQGGWKTISTESNLIVVLYQPGSPYDNYVTAEIAAGRLIAGDIPNGVPFGDPNAQAPPAPPVDPLADDASSSAVGPPTMQKGVPMCGQNCASVNLCTADDGCKCIADPWQGAGSGYFTGTCKIPYFASGGDGRELSEIESNSTTSAINGPSVGNTTLGAFDPATMVLGDTGFPCPCNCTYVSKACCFAEGGIVYEALNLKLGAVKPPNATAVCDPETGDFESSG